jgi:hypothetical protein
MGNLGGARGGNTSEPPRLPTRLRPLALLKATYLIFGQGDLNDKFPSFSLLERTPQHSKTQLSPARPRELTATLAHKERGRQCGLAPSEAKPSRNQPPTALLATFGLQSVTR